MKFFSSTNHIIVFLIHFNISLRPYFIIIIAQQLIIHGLINFLIHKKFIQSHKTEQFTLSYCLESFSLSSSLLPAPTQQVWDRDDELKAKRVGSALVVSQTSVPPYGQRKGWIPRAEEDFGGNLLHCLYHKCWFSI